MQLETVAMIKYIISSSFFRLLMNQVQTRVNRCCIIMYSLHGSSNVSRRAGTWNVSVDMDMMF